MEWISDPNPHGAWLRERLDDDPSIMAGSVIPRGFPAYARVFHPPQVRSLPDRPVPEMDEWVRMPDAEQQRLIELFDDRETTWAETARAFGTTLHGLAQWGRIVRTPVDGDWRVRIAPDGREFTCPDEGRMPPALLAPLAEHLAAHTTSPDAGFVAVWEGWGSIVGGLVEPSSQSYLIASDEPNHQKVMFESLRDRFNNPFRKPTWRRGILSDEISKGARLELPGRDHVLFSASPRVFTDPAWVLDAPWRDLEHEAHGADPHAQHPSILWPEDHAWVMVSEIDFDSTVVAGPPELVAGICADDRIEALPIREGSDLGWDADEVNR